MDFKFVNVSYKDLELPLDSARSTENRTPENPGFHTMPALGDLADYWVGSPCHLDDWMTQYIAYLVMSTRKITHLRGFYMAIQQRAWAL